MTEFLKFIQGVRDDVVGNHDDQVFSEGFCEAATLFMELLSSRIADLREHIRSGSDPLLAPQALMLAELTELKEETEKALSDFDLGSRRSR